MTIDHASNMSSFKNQLTKLLSGTGTQGAHIQDITEKLSPRDFVRNVMDRDKSAIIEATGVTDNCCDKIFGKLLSPEGLKDLFELEHRAYPEDAPSIKFRKDDGTFAPLAELSVGQKCTALLIIALSKGAFPVVIDQPEDALDIKTVWEDVTQKLRANKTDRQFILTTHNNTVGVSSDADMMVCAEASASSARIECLGGIEHAKEAAIRVLEGGKDPYNLRRKKLNVGD